MKDKALLILVALLTCISTGSAYLSLKANHRSKQAVSNNSARIEQTCHNQKKMSAIEHKLIERQQLQTRGLLKSGITFGISKTQLPVLVAQAERTNHQFLVELDELSAENCSTTGGKHGNQTRTGHKAGGSRLDPHTSPAHDHAGSSTHRKRLNPLV